MATLEKEKVNHLKYYAVGFSKGLQKYVMKITITWISWYND